MDHTLRSTGLEVTYLICLGSLFINWLSLSSLAFLNFLPGWTQTSPFSWRTRFSLPLPKSTSKPQLWSPFGTRYNVGLWFWPRVTTRSGSKRTYRWWVGLLAQGSYGISFMRVILCISRLSLRQDELPVLPCAWMPCVYSWWFSLPAVAAGEVASLERVQFCSIKSPSHVWPFMAYGFQHVRLPCPLPSPGACWNSCQLSRWCCPNISSSVILLSSCLPSFPISGSFPMSQPFASGGQNIGASPAASVLPINIQD